jgi:hypothetical protein
LFYLFTATQRAHALLARAMADSPLRSDALLALMNAAEQALNEFEAAETEATG